MNKTFQPIIKNSYCYFYSYSWGGGGGKDKISSLDIADPRSDYTFCAVRSWLTLSTRSE